MIKLKFGWEEAIKEAHGGNRSEQREGRRKINALTKLVVEGKAIIEDKKERGIHDKCL